MTLWNEFTADFRSYVQGPVNIQYLMSVCLDNLLSCNVYRIYLGSPSGLVSVPSVMH